VGQITIRLDDKMEAKLKRDARDNNKSLAEYCREQLTGELITQPLNKVTLENRIEQLEKMQSATTDTVFFMTRLLYNFLALLKGEDFAKKTWEATEKEFEERS
jgi:hypothetical protein